MAHQDRAHMVCDCSLPRIIFGTLKTPHWPLRAASHSSLDTIGFGCIEPALTLRSECSAARARDDPHGALMECPAILVGDLSDFCAYRGRIVDRDENDLSLLSAN